jgi:mRNA-degrading endonuclease toxin of MazEF toxin-antitoxin module
MRLALYASTPRSAEPNLVALQDEAFAALPTVLVCPLKAGIALTALRVELPWGKGRLIVCTDLARPIRRAALRSMGHLDQATSQVVMERFLQLLAR